MQYVRTKTASSIADDDDFHIDVSDAITAGTNAIAAPAGSNLHWHSLALVDGSDDPVDYTLGETYAYRLVFQWTDKNGKSQRTFGEKIPGRQIGMMQIDDIPPLPSNADILVELTDFSGDPTGATNVVVFQEVAKV